jgi:gamma-glutamylcyclotransferase (GGCT)/AIG2-like uncharacterized protein YtfP
MTTRLATYGTLAPGRHNHHQLAALQGRWRKGTVRGTLVDAGWGAALGCPGLVLDPLGPRVEVDLLDSPDLPAHWARLDAFEGAGYRRALTRVQTAQDAAEDTVEAWIYVVSEPVEGERRVGPASGGTSVRPAARVPAAARHPS